MIDFLQQIYNGLLKLAPGKHRLLASEGLYPNLDYLDDDKKSALEKTLDIEIKKKEYFEQALTHRSYLQVVTDKNLLSNERLEFLGDSVLGLIIADYLFSLHVNVMEGELTKMRSWLVNKNTLAIFARHLGLDKYLLMSFSAAKALEKGSENILADALEAIIGAIYLDSGISLARKFIINTLLPIITTKNTMVDKNYKSILLEVVQSSGKPAPKYSVIEETGPDHEKEFVVGVFVGDEQMGTGKGKSKKQAEQIAAENALHKLQFDEENNKNEEIKYNDKLNPDDSNNFKVDENLENENNKPK